MTKSELKALREKASHELPYFEKALERDATLFKWKSDNLKLPFQPEMILTLFGALGYDKKHACWVTGSFNNIRDEYGDYKEFIGITLGTEDKKSYVLKNHEDVIVCGNTPLYRDYNDEREFYAYYKSETDKSIFCQLINSRLNKAILAESDNKKKQIEKAFEAVKKGAPLVLVTSLLENLETIDLTDPDDIEKMQYLSGFYSTIEKRESNDLGIDLENIEKRAQVTTEEIKQYNDYTTLEFLQMYEMRLNFVEEMKEAGFNIQIVPNPVFYDEPKKSDIDNGTFEDAEDGNEDPDGKKDPEDEEKEEDNENGGNET